MDQRSLNRRPGKNRASSYQSLFVSLEENLESFKNECAPEANMENWIKARTSQHRNTPRSSQITTELTTHTVKSDEHEAKQTSKESRRRKSGKSLLRVDDQPNQRVSQEHTNQNAHRKIRDTAPNLQAESLGTYQLPTIKTTLSHTSLPSYTIDVVPLKQPKHRSTKRYTALSPNMSVQYQGTGSKYISVTASQTSDILSELDPLPSDKIPIYRACQEEEHYRPVRKPAVSNRTYSLRQPSASDKPPKSSWSKKTFQTPVRFSERELSGGSAVSMHDESVRAHNRKRCQMDKSVTRELSSNKEADLKLNTVRQPGTIFTRSPAGDNSPHMIDDGETRSPALPRTLTNRSPNPVKPGSPNRKKDLLNYRMHKLRISELTSPLGASPSLNQITIEGSHNLEERQHQRQCRYRNTTERAIIGEGFKMKFISPDLAPRKVDRTDGSLEREPSTRKRKSRSKKSRPNDASIEDLKKILNDLMTTAVQNKEPSQNTKILVDKHTSPLINQTSNIISTAGDFTNQLRNDLQSETEAAKVNQGSNHQLVVTESPTSRINSEMYDIGENQWSRRTESYKLKEVSESNEIYYTHLPEKLFDIKLFDNILEKIFPSRGMVADDELRIDGPDKDTPLELILLNNMAPKFAYVDHYESVRLANELENFYYDKSGTEFRFTVLLSADFDYIRSERGACISLGWTCTSQVFLLYDRRYRRNVVLKIKDKLDACHELVMGSLLRGKNGIALYEGLMVVDNSQFGIVTELITFTNDSQIQVRDLEVLLEHDIRHITRNTVYLSMYQWLDVCIALCHLVVTIHKYNLLSVEIFPRNICLRREGTTWRPYLTDISSICEIYKPKIKQSILSNLYKKRFLAPETLKGMSLTPKSDVYSLGLVLKMIYEGLRLPESQLLKKAISKSPTNRPTAQNILSDIIEQRAVGLVDSDESSEVN